MFNVKLFLKLKRNYLIQDRFYMINLIKINYNTLGNMLKNNIIIF